MYANRGELRIALTFLKSVLAAMRAQVIANKLARDRTRGIDIDAVHPPEEQLKAIENELKRKQEKDAK